MSIEVNLNGEKANIEELERVIGSHATQQILNYRKSVIESENKGTVCSEKNDVIEVVEFKQTSDIHIGVVLKCVKVISFTVVKLKNSDEKLQFQTLPDQENEFAFKYFVDME